MSDNASTDETQEVILKKKKTYPLLRASSNDIQVGYGPNLVKSIGLATGDYVWLLGDDDALEPNAVAAVIDLLKKGPATLTVTSTPYNTTLTRKIGPPCWGLKEDMVFPVGQHEDLIRALSRRNFPHVGFMSTLILSRRMLELPLSSSGAVSTDFIHVTIAYSTARRGFNIVVAQECVKNRIQVRHYRSAYAVWLQAFPQAIVALAGYSSACKVQVVNQASALDWYYHIIMSCWRANPTISFIHQLLRSGATLTSRTRYLLGFACIASYALNRAREALEGFGPTTPSH